MNPNISSSTVVTQLRPLLILFGLALLAGCEQMKSPGYYERPKETTTTDALRQAETGGTRGFVQAPNQVQIKIARSGTQNSTVNTAASAQSNALSTQEHITKTASASQGVDLETLIPQPQTYQGTFPCTHLDMQCTSQRVTLTLAPNGRWRSRSVYLEKEQPSGKKITAQGCWNILPTQPPSLILLGTMGNVRSEMSFLSRNTLKLNAIDGDTPNLTYTLNRQPDLDPIAELDAAKAVPNCN